MSKFSIIGEINRKTMFFNNRLSEVVNKKQDILRTVYNFHNCEPQSVLFVGLSAFVFANYNKAKLYITLVSEDDLEFLKSLNKNVTYIPFEELKDYYKKFQMVVAADEYFTYAKTDEDQKRMVEQLSYVTSNFLLTTLRDLKNQEYRDREFSIPVTLRHNDDHRILLEANTHSVLDKHSWTSTVYEIDATNNVLKSYGPFDRKSMFFKQLAKFSSDCGAVHFMIHKNAMYKGMLRKNYEHVITIDYNF